MIDDHVDRLEAWRESGLLGSFETALETLDEIVAFLESGRHGLDDTVSAYELGVSVATRCESLLASAELRVSQITVDAELARNALPDETDERAEGEPSTDSDDEPPF
jgi:exodeoxyribonuclease VII small subunit